MRDTLYDNGQSTATLQDKLKLMTNERSDNVAKTTQLDAEITELKDNEAWCVTEQEKLTIDVSMLTDAWGRKRKF